jgi:hypothetical protein
MESIRGQYAPAAAGGRYGEQAAAFLLAAAAAIAANRPAWPDGARGGSRVPGKPDQGTLTLLANAPMRP